MFLLFIMVGSTWHDDFLYFTSSNCHVSSVLIATLLVESFGADTAAYDLLTTANLHTTGSIAISTNFLASVNDSLFCTLTCWTLYPISTVNTLMSMHSGFPCSWCKQYILCMSLVMVWKTTMGTYSLPQHVLSMSKPLTFHKSHPQWLLPNLYI